MYDQVYHQAEGYDMKLHRDDRKHYKGRGLNMNEEVKTTLLVLKPSHFSFSLLNTMVTLVIVVG